MSTPTFTAIVEWLTRENIKFRHVHHEPTFTSEESAKARGEPVSVGGKALVVKVGDEFRLFVLSAARKFDSAAVRKHFGVKKIRFAEKEELQSLTGLAPGSVPPFGAPILKLPLHVDPSVLTNEVIAFNAGSLSDSIIMPASDYVRLAKPDLLTCSKDSEA